MNISKKKISISTSIAISIILGILVFGNFLSVSAQQRIDMTFETIEAQIQESLLYEGMHLVNGLPLALSSNPYDYISNNTEYDKLIAMGSEALETLESCLFDTDRYNSFERYIIAIAIEEINKVDLKNFEEYHWANGESFAASWVQIKEDAVTLVPQIITDASLSDEQKQKEVSKFGMLAIEPLQDMLKESQDTAVIENAEDIVDYIIVSSDQEVIRAASSIQN